MKAKQLFILTAVSLLLTSCGIKENTTFLKEASERTYLEWCQDWGLESCQKEPSKQMPIESWDGINSAVFNLGQSDATLNFNRAHYESAAIQNLLYNIVGKDGRDELNKIPFTEISKFGSTFKIETSAPVSYKVNGLNISIENGLVIDSFSPATFSIEGLKLTGTQEGQTLDLKTADLSTANRLQLLGSDLSVSDVDLNFLSPILDDIKDPSHYQVQPVALAHSVSEVLFSPEFDLNDIFNANISQGDIENIREDLQAVWGDDEASQIISSFLAKMESASVLGHQENMATLNLNDEFKCKIYVTNVPVIGSTSISITLKESLGLNQAEKTNNGFKLPIFGISTGYGDLKRVELDNEKLKIKVGWLTIPISLETGGDNGEGDSIEVKSVECA